MSAFSWSTKLLTKALAFGGSVAVVTVLGTNYKLNVTHAAKPQPWNFYEPSVLWDHNWDKRDPESLLKPCVKNGPDSKECKEALEKFSPSSSRHLFLIRHGQYCMDGDEDKDRCLSKLGQEQAKLTGKRLKELDLPYTLLIHSTMARAHETADIICKHLPDIPVESSDLIREGAPIPPEPPVGHWRPEAQQFYEDGARIEAAFRKFFHRADSKQTGDSYEVVVCHANVIRYFVCRAMQFPPEAWLRFTVHNCSITWITIHASGRVILRALGDAGHLPADKLTTS